MVFTLQSHWQNSLRTDEKKVPPKKSEGNLCRQFASTPSRKQRKNQPNVHICAEITKLSLINTIEHRDQPLLKPYSLFIQQCYVLQLCVDEVSQSDIDFRPVCFPGTGHTTVCNYIAINQSPEWKMFNFLFPLRKFTFFSQSQCFHRKILSLHFLLRKMHSSSSNIMHEIILLFKIIMIL